MKSLLLIAHGSRREASNEEVRTLTETLKKQAGGRYGQIACAFLELAEPSIPDGIEACVQAGATEITVLPYFLSAGRHVAQDIPEAVAPKQQQYPQLTIQIAPYLGSADALVGILLDLAQQPTA